MKVGTILTQYSFIKDEGIALQCTVDGNHPPYDLWLYDISMIHKGGYGQYKLIVMVQYNSDMYIFTKHSTDSIMYDELNSDELTDERKEEILTNIFESVMQANEGKIFEIESKIKIKNQSKNRK